MQIITNKEGCDNGLLGRVHNLPRGGAMVILRGGHHFLTLQ
jgi:hypothetical protein